jgi:hypothetical protein
LALEMSGFLLWGSSAVFSWNSIFAAGSITSFTTWWRQEKKEKSVCNSHRGSLHSRSSTAKLTMPQNEWLSPQSSVPKQDFWTAKTWGRLQLLCFQIKLEEASSDLCKFQHCELPRISQIERPYMLTLHQSHQAIHLHTNAVTLSILAHLSYLTFKIRCSPQHPVKNKTFLAPFVNRMPPYVTCYTWH